MQDWTPMEQMAALAMIGLCANSVPGPQNSPAWRAREAHDIAEAMFAESARRKAEREADSAGERHT